MATTTKPTTTTEDDGDDYVGINVLVRGDLHRRIKAQAALDGQTLAEVTEAAYLHYLDTE